jgi:hypothetical protein
MTIVSCPIEGSYLVNEFPLPMGKTLASGVAVYDYNGHWVCEDCGSSDGSTKRHCRHVGAVIKKLEGEGH